MTDSRDEVVKFARGYKLPLRYDENGSLAWDADNVHAFDVRGWGHLTGRGGLRLNENDATEVQDAFGRYVVAAVNERAALLTRAAEAEALLKVAADALRETREAAAACFRVIHDNELTGSIEARLRQAGVADGFGKRAGDALARLDAHLAPRVGAA